MAQDWHELFPSKKDPLRIETLDLDGVTLSALKGLLKKVTELEEQMTELHDLKGLVMEVCDRLSALESAE